MILAVFHGMKVMTKVRFLPEVITFVVCATYRLHSDLSDPAVDEAVGVPHAAVVPPLPQHRVRVLLPPDPSSATSR